ncbi:hypothetical protein AB204_10585 [Xenorhabdus khoisanae]|uniref:Bacteriophage T4 Gp32 single-stranded DNA-binding domain-containing protein n=1 Tax=Xenorhabdus khoisanae TaxID=880157 RepID=A0A0J5IPJ6_9GAMM|nr:hypothetical protein [Xenorhabdus khoisanae]KMJ45135.1 hypothetical protein AB204_10585 [Xenorhabdus khoisanae]
MSTLLELIKGKRKELASKRASRGVDIAKLQSGVQYLRIFPNVENPNAVFYQPFGMHFVKTKEAGKEKTVASVCKTATYGESCELCEAIMEAKAVHKGNSSMEDLISEIRSSQRYIINGALTATPDINLAEKTQLVELPQTVFEDVLKSIEEDMSDEIGEPLDIEKGYCFKIERTGAGRDTQYTVSPVRKDGKAAVPTKLLSSIHNLENFANGLNDANKLAIAGKAIGTLTGVSVAISSTMALPATGTTGTALPGFSSLAAGTGSTTGTTGNAAKEAAQEAVAAEFTGVASVSTVTETPTAHVAPASSEALGGDELADMMAQLEGL